MAKYDFEPDARFPPHSHREEQITLLEKGLVEFTVDGTPVTLTPGAWVVVPPGTEHSLRAGPNGASVLIVIVPSRPSVDAYTVTE